MPDLSRMTDEQLDAIIAGGQGQPQAAPVLRPPRLAPPPPVAIGKTAAEMTDAELDAIVASGPPPPPPDTTEGSLKAGGTGLVRGLANIPGLPGDLKSMVDTGADWLLGGAENLVGYKRTPEQEAAMRHAQGVGHLPTSQDIRDAAAKVPGAIELYEPRTPWEKGIETVGEFTSGALGGPARRIPDIIRQAVKFGTIPGLVSEGAGQLSEKILPGNAVAQAVARTAGGMGAAGGAAYLSRNQGIRPPAPGVDPAARMKQAEEFGVPLTEGQSTGNISQQAFEEAARYDAKGPAATRTMQEFDLRQKAALDAAAAGPMRERFQGGFAPVEGADVAGEQIAAAVKKRSADLHDQSQAKYREAERLNPSIKAGEVRSISQDVAGRLSGSDISWDPGVHPTAFRAMGEIERLATLPGAPSGVKVLGMDVRGIENVRKRMIKMKATSDEDQLALGEVRDAFDDWLDDAVNKELFTGDPKGVEALKEARSLWSAHKSMTKPRPGSPNLDASNVIANMVKNDVTGQQVSNWLYGSSIVNPPATSVRVAQRLKGMFKQDSPEWSAVRQGAWNRVIQGSTASEKGAQAISTAVNEFLNGRGKALAQVLYSPEERELMRRFGQTAKYLVPNPKATNPSKSSYGMARMAASMASRGIGAALGFTHGGLMEMGLGALGGGALDKGMKAIEQVGYAASANRLVNPKLNAPIFDPQQIGVLVGRTGVEAMQPERRLSR